MPDPATLIAETLTHAARHGLGLRTALALAPALRALQADRPGVRVRCYGATIHAAGDGPRARSDATRGALRAAGFEPSSFEGVWRLQRDARAAR